MTTRELLQEYRELRDAGASPMARRDAFNAWFRQACRDGTPPDALARNSPDEAERFWARTVPGPDGHVYWTGGKTFYANDRRTWRPCRWAWVRKHRGRLDPKTFIEPTCGESNCVNADHLAIVPRAERRYRFPDYQAIGAVQVLALRLGRTPRGDEWDAAGLPITHAAIGRRFGTWNRFLIAAGIEPNPANGRATEAQCEAAVQALTRHLGRRPTSWEWRQNADWLREHGHPTSEETIGIRRRLAPPRRGRGKR